MTVRIVVVDDHPVVVDGVRGLLAGHPDLVIVGEAWDRESALDLVERLRPDVVLLDLCLGDQPDATLCGDLLAVAPGSRVLLHTAYHARVPVQSCLDAGGLGVIYKDGRDLVPALTSVAEGNPFVAVPSGDHGTEAVGALSPREYDVLCALAMGRSTGEIAESLNLTVSTVRSYVKALLTKLGASSRVEALATARRLHLL